MPYRISADPGRPLLLVVVSGSLDTKAAVAMVTEARDRAHAKKLNILYDFRGAVPGKFQNADVFWLPRKVPVLQVPEARRVRSAILHLAPQRELAQFCETTFTNLGLQARAFEDEAAAFAWLTEGAPT